MTGEGVNDAPALKKADIGIPVADSTDAASSAADLVLTEPGLSVIVGAVLTSRAIFQRMKNYTIYAVSITIRIVLGFMLLALIWVYDFPPFMVLIIAILNDGTIMTISQDCVKPSPTPDSWKLNEIFAAGIVIGTYLALVTVLFYWLADSTQFFETAFTSKKDYGKEDREAKWVLSQRTLQGVVSPEFEPKSRRPCMIAEQAMRRAEITRLSELHTLRGHVESVSKLKDLDINKIQGAHTV
ncbi:hypothetical protein RND71_026743 [Anisodus tanguticus]|uniref:Uncharacterized protein n=1 Tax=Anisodus tanguticus TaxID=243964 RepID=A0AAE1VAS5_9SOLA|nr:hypothetical protein RND71_026743 [Anisodus tanguticus]